MACCGKGLTQGPSTGAVFHGAATGQQLGRIRGALIGPAVSTTPMRGHIRGAAQGRVAMPAPAPSPMPAAPSPRVAVPDPEPSPLADIPPALAVEAWQNPSILERIAAGLEWIDSALARVTSAAQTLTQLRQVASSVRDRVSQLRAPAAPAPAAAAMTGTGNLTQGLALVRALGVARGLLRSIESAAAYAPQPERDAVARALEAAAALVEPKSAMAAGVLRAAAARIRGAGTGTGQLVIRPLSTQLTLSPTLYARVVAARESGQPDRVVRSLYQQYYNQAVAEGSDLIPLPTGGARPSRVRYLRGARPSPFPISVTFAFRTRVLPPYAIGPAGPVGGYSNEQLYIGSRFLPRGARVQIVGGPVAGWVPIRYAGPSQTGSADRAGFFQFPLNDEVNGWARVDDITPGQQPLTSTGQQAPPLPPSGPGAPGPETDEVGTILPPAVAKARRAYYSAASTPGMPRAVITSLWRQYQNAAKEAGVSPVDDRPIPVPLTPLRPRELGKSRPALPTLLLQARALIQAVEGAALTAYPPQIRSLAEQLEITASTVAAIADVSAAQAAAELRAAAARLRLFADDREPPLPPWAIRPRPAPRPNLILTTQG